MDTCEHSVADLPIEINIDIAGFIILPHLKADKVEELGQYGTGGEGRGRGGGGERGGEGGGEEGGSGGGQGDIEALSETIPGLAGEDYPILAQVGATLSPIYWQMCFEDCVIFKGL